MHIRRHSLFLLLLLWPSVLLAQTVNPFSGTANPSAAAEPVEIAADRIEYDNDLKVLEGFGSAVIDWGGDRLSADYLKIQTDTMDVYARGNVLLVRTNMEWAGEEMSYNMRDATGSFDAFRAQIDVFYLYGDQIDSVSSNLYEIDQAVMTTCDPGDHEYKVTARRATIKDGRYLKGYHLIFYLFDKPFFYVPVSWRDLSDDKPDLDITPGYSSSWGPYLLTSYTMYPEKGVDKFTTRLDLRAKRGVGFGEEVFWSGRETNRVGKIKVYYTEDKEPLQSDRDRELYADTVEEERYRIRLIHQEALSDRDAALIDMHYVSDPKVLDDFFKGETDAGSEPENRIVYTHRGDQYVAGVNVNKRLNDFYDNIDRVPEVYFDLSSRELRDSGFYYRSQNSAARLKRLYQEGSEQEDYESFRFDSHHAVNRPLKWFGFLNVIPGFSYRGTYYSDTRPDEIFITNLVTTVSTSGVVSTVSEVRTNEMPNGSTYRSVIEMNLDLSYKAFKVLNEKPNRFGLGLRHVAEPYAAYLYRPEPSATPDELYEFDAIDTISKTNVIFIGMRNKLQTKKSSSLISDLINLDLYTTYRVEKESGEDSIGPFVADLKLNPATWAGINVRTTYEHSQSEFRTIDAAVSVGNDLTSNFKLNYIYRNESRDYLTAEINLYPMEKWSYQAYWKYDFEAGNLEEHAYRVLRRLDCIGMSFGFRHEPGYDGEEDEYDFEFMFWVLALADTPESW